MDLSLIIFISVVAFFTLRGYGKGLYRSVARIVSLLSGYIAAVLYTVPVAAVIETHYQLQGMAASITAAACLFAGAAFGTSLLFWVLGMLLGNKEPRSTASGFGGALVGLAVGAVVALSIVWSIAQVRDLNQETVAAGESEQSHSAVETFANQVAGKVVDDSASVAAVRKILSDPTFQQQLQSGDPKALLNDPRLLALADRIFPQPSDAEQQSQSQVVKPVAPPVLEQTPPQQMPVDASASASASAGRSIDSQASTAGTLDSAQREDKRESEPQIYHWIDEQGRSHFSTADPG